MPAAPAAADPHRRLGEQVLGQMRLGVNRVRLIASLRAVARLPFATIQGVRRTLWGRYRSQGELVHALGQVARRGQPEVARLQEQLCQRPVVHAAATGWRENGRKG